MACSSSTSPPSISELTAALKSATTLLESAETAAVEFTSQLRYITCKVEKALANFPHDYVEISEILKEEISILRCQLEIARTINIKNSDSGIPADFICPISLQLFVDPVVVSTGQTYERSFIQSWIDSGKTTCPKTLQNLENLTLTPNYVLKNLIGDWCTHHNVVQKQPTLPTNTTPRVTESIIDGLSSPSQPIEEERQRPTIIDNLRSPSFFSFVFCLIIAVCLEN